MRNTFLNNNNQLHFEENGYILKDAFLEPAEITALRDFYEANKEGNMTGFHASMHSKDLKLRTKISAFIADIFYAKSKDLLDNYRPVVGNFTVKEPGVESFFDFHLDWNMLDERFARSVTIWIPLEDTNSVNGNLWILEKSNNFPDTFRCGPGLNLLSKSRSDFEKFHFKKKELPMKAGDAIIYDHKLIHGSPPNMSQSPRLAINLALLPREVQAIHYFYKNDLIETYEVPDSFFNECLTHEPMDMKKFNLTSVSDTHKEQVDQQTMNLLLNQKEING